MGFGEYSLPHIIPLSEKDRSRWFGQIPLTSRIAFLRDRGVEQEELKALYRLWGDWKQLV